jgi:hypothetical protein
MRSTLRAKNEKSLEEQIAFVRWRRMQNERQIRTFLETTKILTHRDELMCVSMDQGRERSMWMTSVIKDELSRPLVITDEEMHRLQESEAKVKKKLCQFTQVKLGTIAKINKDLVRQKQYISTELAIATNTEKIKNMADIEKRTRTTLADSEARTDLVKQVQIPPKLFY